MKVAFLVLALVAVALAKPQTANSDTATYACDSSKGTYNWPVTDDCSKYYQCVNGAQTVKSCLFSWIRKFNRNSLACDWWFKVDCNDVPVPEPSV